MSFRAPPCCCCICCCKPRTLTKEKIRFIRGCVYQMPYVQGAVLFFMTICTIGERERQKRETGTKN